VYPNRGLLQENGRDVDEEQGCSGACMKFTAIKVCPGDR
jgi:hypothetical protein